MLRSEWLLNKFRRSYFRFRRSDGCPLSSGQIARCRSDGLVIPAFRLPESALVQFEDALSAVLPDKPADTPDFVGQLHGNPGLAAAVVGFARTPEILSMVGQLVGEDIALWGAGLFGKPPVHGKATPWHQDAAILEYQAIRPIELCTVWVALDDSTPENGCVRYVPGSHQSRTIHSHVRRPSEAWTLEHMLEEQNWSESRACDAILKKGQLSIHDVFLIHGSTANRSGRRRAGITLRYMPSTSVYDRKFAQQFGAANRPIYLLRGIDRCGLNDLLAPPAVA